MNRSEEIVTLVDQIIAVWNGALQGDLKDVCRITDWRQGKVRNLIATGRLRGLQVVKNGKYAVLANDLAALMLSGGI